MPLEETVDVMEELVKKGLIRTWGVSNFDTEDINDLYRVPYGKNCAVNQVLYHLGSRGIEYELLDNLEAHDIAAMAYCPLAQAGELKNELLKNEQLKGIARKHNTTVLQILLAFVLKNENIAAIPRSGNPHHILENIYAEKIILDQEDLAAMNQAFPAPKHKTPLDIV